MEKITTINIVNQEITDKALREILLSLDVEEVFVLPSNLTRSKQVLYGKNIKIGTFIDYPLASGTLAKIAFETGAMIQLGAEMLQIPLPLFEVKKKKYERVEELVKMLTPLRNGRELRFSITTSTLKELEKIRLAQKISALGVTHLTLEVENMTQAIHDVSIFRLDGGENMVLQVNVKKFEEEKLAELYRCGVNKVGMVYTEKMI